MADRDEDWYRMRNIWYNMIHRTKRDDNSWYGSRGITVCEKWLCSFDAFYEDMKIGYASDLSIDRIDNNKGYYPENCRWATPTDQANNRRTNRFFTIDGVTKTLAQWCKTSEFKPSTIRQRVYVYGWSIEEALSGVKEH